MGYCVTMPESVEEIFSVEVRSESVTIHQHYTKYPPETEPKMFADGGDTYHVEMERGFLEHLLAFFDNPENRKLCRLNVPPPHSAGK